MLVISLQRLWETASKFEHLPSLSLASFSISCNPWFFLRQRLCPCVAINWLLLQVRKYAIFLKSLLIHTPCSSLFLIFSFRGGTLNGRPGWKAKRPPASQKNVQISHLVVFMLRAPCGPWRCWKHGKHRRDQSNLISIRSELEWPGCMARPSPLSGPRRPPLLLCPPPLCAFVFFQDFFVMSGCFPRRDVAKRIMGKDNIMAVWYFDSSWTRSRQNKSEIKQWDLIKSFVVLKQNLFVWTTELNWRQNWRQQIFCSPTWTWQHLTRS